MVKRLGANNTLFADQFYPDRIGRIDDACNDYTVGDMTLFIFTDEKPTRMSVSTGCGQGSYRGVAGMTTISFVRSYASRYVLVRVVDDSRASAVCTS